MEVLTFGFNSAVIANKETDCLQGEKASQLFLGQSQVQLGCTKPARPHKRLGVGHTCLQGNNNKEQGTVSSKYGHARAHTGVYVYVYRNACVYMHQQNPLSADPSLLRSATC